MEHDHHSRLPRLEAAAGDTPFFTVAGAEFLGMGMAATMPPTTSPALADVVGIIHFRHPIPCTGRPRRSRPTLPAAIARSNQAEHNVRPTKASWAAVLARAWRG
jgi:hypothetical protein